VAYRPIVGSLGTKLGPRRLNRKGRGFVKTARAYPWAVPYLFHSYIRVSGRIRARATHEKSATESGNAETILVASYLKTGVSTATAPRKYGTVLVFERMTVRGSNCPAPPWSRTAWESRVGGRVDGRDSFISTTWVTLKTRAAMPA